LSVDGLFVDVGASGIEPIRVGVKWYSRVARMTKTVEAGKPVSPADIRFSWERTDSDIEVAIAALGDIRETETRQRVRKDEILTSAALRPARLVKAGDLVRVTYLRGVIAVELTGRAQETGERGDRINVKLSFGAGKSAVLAARITARGEVIIERS
jgi:flagella basal body P-ring formation protein FlgA